MKRDKGAGAKFAPFAVFVVFVAFCVALEFTVVEAPASAFPFARSFAIVAGLTLSLFGLLLIIVRFTGGVIKSSSSSAMLASSMSSSISMTVTGDAGGVGMSEVGRRLSFCFFMLHDFVVVTGVSKRLLKRSWINGTEGSLVGDSLLAMEGILLVVGLYALPSSEKS